MIITKLLWLKNHIFKSKNYFSQTSFNSDIRKTKIWIWIFYSSESLNSSVDLVFESII